MEWSTDLHLVSLLQKYLFTPPQVTPLVRGQLQTIDESDKIQVALRQVMKLWRTLETPYDELLNHTCLDWRNERLVNLVSSDLPPAMFDLMLGDKFMRPLLNEYTDVHSVRRRIQNFVELLPGDAQLWWDGVTEYAVPHRRWVSKSLAQDPDFEGLLDSWLNDNQALQTWLQQYEKTTRLVNNSDQPATRVFSEEVAIEVMKFGKVGVSQRMVVNLAHNHFQVQAGLFDKRRARLFAYKSIEFKKECTALGLFEARLPQFSQLFFHNFTDSETELLLGQSETGGQVAHRAAEAYLRSGVRLESSCGMSDIWYDYVESNAKLFRSPSSAAVPSGPSSLSHPPIFPPLQSSPPPRPDSQQLEHIRSFLDWHMAHLRFRPTEKSVKSPEHKSDDCSENSQPEDTTLPPSKVLACHGPDPADAAEQEDEKDASWMEIGKDEHETEGLIVVEEQRVEALGSPIAVAEREDTDTGSDGYQFEDEWPTTRSFEIAMSKMLDQVDLQVSQMPKVSVVTGGHGSDQTLDITKCQTDGAGSSGKRARQDSNACERSQPVPPHRILTHLSQQMERRRYYLPQLTGHPDFRDLQRSGKRVADYTLLFRRLVIPRCIRNPAKPYPHRWKHLHLNPLDEFLLTTCCVRNAPIVRKIYSTLSTHALFFRRSLSMHTRFGEVLPWSVIQQCRFRILHCIHKNETSRRPNLRHQDRRRNARPPPGMVAIS